MTSRDLDLPGILRKCFAKLPLKVICALKKLESSFINCKATELVEELSGAKALEKSGETSETSKSETGRRVTDFEVAHFILNVCNFAWTG